jgi:hypothetical protein
MPRHKEHLKNYDGESEVVVVLGPYYSLICPKILKLRRLMRWRTDFAEPPRAIYRYLIRITVNQTDGSLTSDEQITVVHVANDVSTLMNHGKGSGCICGAADQELPTCSWEFS